MNREKKLVWQVWALIAVVFILGGISGAAVTNLYHTRRASHNATEPAAGNRPPRRERMRERMKQELNLSDEQATQISAIMEESRAQFRAAFDGCAPLKEAREQTANRIRALLTPEQQQKFDELRARREKEGVKR